MNNPTLPQTPDQRIKELEVQHNDAHQKARLFEAMLDVIKNEYGISIPKKPLGRSSGKLKSKA